MMAAELVDTTRLYARTVAQIQPEWLEKVGGHLLKKSFGEPRWEKASAQVSAFERATLYGLVVYSQRRIHYGLINPVEAREIVNVDQVRTVEIGYRNNVKSKVLKESLMLTDDENIIDLQFAVKNAQHILLAVELVPKMQVELLRPPHLERL